MARRLMALLMGAALLGAPPVRAASPDITGLWEGAFHRARGDQAVAVVFRPRGASSFAGMVYFGGEFGPIESGRLFGDSLTFRATHYPFAGAVSGKTMALSLMIPHGATHSFTLTQTSPDTTRLPASMQNAPPVASQPAIPRDVAPDSVYMAHAVSPDAAPGTLPCLQRGTLLLVGGGAGQADLYARFLQLAGGAATARIVVIPTAHIETTDRAAVEQFGDNAARVFGVPHVQLLHTFSRQEADTEAFVKPLRTATGVWIDGGEGSYLLNAYMGTRTERELVALLDRGGVIAGTSAGALIWGSRSMVSRAHPGAKAYELPTVDDLLIGHVREPGFGVLQNVLISPHFTEFTMQPSLEKMLAAYPHLLAFGIDEATALEVHAGTCTVLGRSNVSIFRGNGTKPLFVLKDGARFDLRRLTVL